jgi:hypothetical protein
MLKPKQGGLASCPPDYLKHQISRFRLNTTAFPSRYLARSTYEKNGYKPDFDKLPLEDEYKAAREKLRNAPRP